MALKQFKPVTPSQRQLVLVDRSRRGTVDRAHTASRSRNNPYHGIDLPDPVELTVWAGRVTHRR